MGEFYGIDKKAYLCKKNTMKKLIFLLILQILSVALCLGQEIKCNVIINADRVFTQERQVFTRLQKSIADFMNTTRWTNDQFQPNEQVICNMLITFDQIPQGKDAVTDVQSGVYYASAQITVSRPVYGTDFSSPVFSFIDRSFNFVYQINEPLIYIENVSKSNLTLMLAYYAYTILALDYDSFGQKGGSPYIEKLININNNALNITGFEATGWQQSDVRNRYWIAENLNNPQMIDFREALYDYHRKGLDIFLQDADKARENMIEAIEKMKKVSNVKPNSVVISGFFVAKSDELYNIFEKASPEMKQNAANLFFALDPANTTKYEKLTR